MGFYAKGSPGAFLHLTEQSDARGAVSDDTIFHSSLPHVYIEKEWYVNTGITVPWINFGDGNRWNNTLNRNLIVDAARTEMNGKLGGVRLGDLPSDLVSEFGNRGSVILVEAIYSIGGQDYSKIISGLSIGSSGHLAVEAPLSGNNHQYSIMGVLTNRCTVSCGIGVHMGFTFNSGNILRDLGAKNTMGYNSYLTAVGLKNYWIQSSDGNYRRDQAYGQLLKSYWHNQFTGNAMSAINVNTETGGTISPYRYYPRVIISNRGVDSVVGGGYGFTSDIAPYMVYPRDHYYKSANSYDGTFPRSSAATLDGYRNSIGVSAPPYLNANDRYMFDTNDGRDSRAYGLMDFSMPRTPDINYNQIPYRLKFTKLNISYNDSSGYSIRPQSTSGEIRIGSGTMQVGGINFANSGLKMLYQINSSSPMVYRRTFANYGYTNVNHPSNNLLLASEGCANSGGSIHWLGGNLNPQSSYTIGEAAVSGTGWGCTPDSIFNSRGAFWSKNSIPLTLRSNSTSRFTVGGQSGSVNARNTTGIVKHQTINMGLSTRRPTAIIFNIKSTDPSILFNGTSWYSIGGASNTGHHVNTSGSLSVQSNHGLIVLPIGQYVPVITCTGFTSQLYFGRSGSTHYYEPRCDFVGTVFWMYNEGNGNLSIYSTHSNYANTTYSYYNNANCIASTSANLFKVPQFTLDVVKLS